MSLETQMAHARVMTALIENLDDSGRVRAAEKLNAMADDAGRDTTDGEYFAKMAGAVTQYTARASAEG